MTFEHRFSADLTLLLKTVMLSDESFRRGLWGRHPAFTWVKCSWLGYRELRGTTDSWTQLRRKRRAVRRAARRVRR